MRRSALQIIFLVALFGWFLASESRRDLVSIEAAYADWLDANAPRALPPASVTLVEINEESLGRDGQWPWSPLNYLLFLQSAAQFGFGVTSVEPVLDWGRFAATPDDSKQGHLQYEKILQDFVRKMPKILLGARLGFPEDPDVVPPLEAVPQIRHVAGDVTKLPQFTAIEQQPGEEMRLSAMLGFTNVGESRDTTRTVPLVFNYRGEVVPSFVLQAAIMWFKLTPDDVSAVLGSHIALGPSVKIPIDAAGNMRIDFRASVSRYGSADLLLAAQQAEQKLNPIMPIEALKDQVVLLARTDPAARSLRLPVAIVRPKTKNVADTTDRAVPDSRAASSGELIAHAIATIQSRSFFRRAPITADLAIIALAMVAGFFAVQTRRLQNLVLLATLALVTYLLAAITVFGFWLMVLPLLLPAGLAAFIVVFVAISPREKK